MSEFSKRVIFISLSCLQLLWSTTLGVLHLVGNSETAFEVSTRDEKPLPSRKPPLTSYSRPEKVMFTWASVESGDYQIYIQNLLNVGFPAPLIRAMITAEINSIYEEDELALSVPEGVTISKNVRRLKALRDLQIEKQQILIRLFKTYMPRTIMAVGTDPESRALEGMLKLVEVTKRDHIQTLFEDFWLDEGVAQEQIPDKKKQLTTYIRLSEELWRELRAYLTDEEVSLFERNCTWTGRHVASRTIRMAPSTAELRDIYRLTKEFDREMGAVYDRPLALNKLPTERLEAEARFHKELKKALGPERFGDYLIATSNLGHRVSHFCDRYGLSSQFARDLFHVVQEASHQVLQPGGNSAHSLREIDEEFRRVFGRDDLYEAWQTGSIDALVLDPNL